MKSYNELSREELINELEKKNNKILESKATEKEFKKDNDLQNTINSILRITLEPLSFNEKLYKILECILSIQWLSLQKKGCIYLIDENNPNSLAIASHYEFTPEQLERCLRIKLGECLCGLAASTGKIHFCHSSKDSLHVIKYNNMIHHGHYCVPIKSEDEVLGVLNMYVQEDHKNSSKEEEFLYAVANTLAGIIKHEKVVLERQKFQQRLLQSVDALEQLAEKITGSFDLDKVLHGIIQACRKISNASMGSIYLYNKDTKELIMRADVGHKSKLLYKTKFLVPDSKDKQSIGLTPYVFLDCQPLILRNKEEIINHHAHLAHHYNDYFLEEEHAQFWAGIPINDLNNTSLPLGVITIKNTLDEKNKINFTDDMNKILQYLARIASIAINKVQLCNENMDNAFNKIFNFLCKKEDLQEKLIDILNILQEITNADGASIWLIEGGFLRCTCGIGIHKKLEEEKADYEITFDLSDLSPSTKKVGITAWIAEAGEIVHTKTYTELVDHPHYLGKYVETYLEKSEKCESFIGIPLKIANNTIGVLKADKLTKDANSLNFFTEEDAQFIKYLSTITAFAINSSKEFDKMRQHDHKTISLYKIGNLYNELRNREEILWYFLTALTHNEGIGFNRVVLFDIIGSVEQIYLKGNMSIGPKDKREGFEFEKALDTMILKVDLDEDLLRFYKEGYRVPETNLQNYIKNISIPIRKNSQCYKFINNLNQSEPLLLNIEQCGNELHSFFKAIESDKPIMFGFEINDGLKMIGFCDYVYTPEPERNSNEYNFGLLKVILNQIKLSIPRIDLRKTEEETREKAWREFSASTAHRIGTEVADIGGSMYWLNQQNSSVSKDIQQYYKRINNSLGRLNIAVREYTEYATPGEMKYTRFDIIDLVCSADKKAKFLERGNIKVNIVKKDELLYIGDSEKLIYSFRELFHNAFKAIKDKVNGIISVSICYDESKEKIVLEFIDDGCGISPEYRDKIFEFGTRLRKGGTGLGLTIVKRNIEAHGGTIRLKENIDNKTNFIIELPVKNKREFVFNKNILLVEDEENLAYDIQKAIKHNYMQLHRFDWAQTENEGIKKIDQNSYDIILTDIRLNDSIKDDIGGINILRKAVEKNKKTKVIVFTSYAWRKVTNESRKEVPILQYCLELGAYDTLGRDSDYLIKILEIVDKALVA